MLVKEATGRRDIEFKSVISEKMLQIKFMSISSEIALRWMSQNTSDD